MKPTREQFKENIQTITLVSLICLLIVSCGPTTVAPITEPVNSTPSLTFMFYQDDIPELYSINMDGSSFRKLLDGFENAQFPEWSPDGNFISFLSTSKSPLKVTLYVVNPTDGEIRTQIENVKDFDWAPDGNGLAYTQFDDQLFNSGEMFLAYEPEWTPVRLIETTLNIGAIHWSPRGDYILTKLNNRDTGAASAVIIDLNGNIETLQIEGKWFSWDSTGQKIVYSILDGLYSQIRTINVEDYDNRALTEGGNYSEFYPRWSPSGDYVAYIHGKWGGNSGIHLLDIETRNTTQISPNDQQSSWFSWSPDGEYLAYLTINESEELRCSLSIYFLDTNQSVELVENNVDCSNPAWRP